MSATWEDSTPGQPHMPAPSPPRPYPMSYSDALNALMAGQRVGRRGWNGKGMWIYLAKQGVCERHIGGNDDGVVVFQVSLEPFIVMRTAQGTYVPWLCSQTDAVANDWELVA